MCHQGSVMRKMSGDNSDSKSEPGVKRALCAALSLQVLVSEMRMGMVCTLMRSGTELAHLRPHPEMRRVQEHQETLRKAQQPWSATLQPAWSHLRRWQEFHPLL